MIMATSARRKSKAIKDRLPYGAWHALESVWGEAQKVRLVTGVPAIVGDPIHIRSIHVVAFVAPDDGILLVQNKDQTWTFPGGRVEASESLDDTLIREVWEEARARIAPDYVPIAATRIEFLNRVPGRVYRVHPTYLSWVMGDVAELSDEPHHDPADGVIGRSVVPPEEAKDRLGPLERSVLDAALTLRRNGKA